MRGFLINLSLLAAGGIVLFIISPSMMKQVFEIFNGTGLLLIFIAMVILAALPHRSRRRRR
jgi:hypothetical protein